MLGVPGVIEKSPHGVVKPLELLIPLAPRELGHIVRVIRDSNVDPIDSPDPLIASSDRLSGDRNNIDFRFEWTLLRDLKGTRHIGAPVSGRVVERGD